MKKFIIRSTLFLLLSTILMVALDLCTTYQLQHSKQRFFVPWNDILHGGIEADMIVMGNSRARAHFSPIILDSVLGTNTYNLGYGGSCINRQFTRYHIYRHHNTKPKIILQNIDYLTIRYTSDFDRFQFYPYFYLSEMRDSIFPAESFPLADKYLPMYRYANFGIDNLFKPVKYNMTRGYLGDDRNWNHKNDTLQEASHYSPYINPAMVDVMDHYLGEIRAEGIQVVLVYSPLYSGLMEQISNHDSILTLISEWSEKYHIPVLDYSQDSMCSDINCFYDDIHLNKTGAERFSRILAEDLKKLILQ